jgi:hypothetical protein
LRTWPQNAQAGPLREKVVSFMRDEMVSTTERALCEFFPMLGKAFMACVSEVTAEEALRLRFADVNTSKVTMSAEDVQGGAFENRDSLWAEDDFWAIPDLRGVRGVASLAQLIGERDE